jgi:hypothetical protein
MHPSSRPCAERRRRGGFGSGGSREAGRPERHWSDDAEHGFLDDVVAGRNRLAGGRPLDAGRIVDAVDAGRSVGTLNAGGIVDAGRSVSTLSAGCIVDAIDAGRSVSTLSAGCAFSAGCTAGRGLLARQTS